MSSYPSYASPPPPPSAVGGPSPTNRAGGGAAGGFLSRFPVYAIDFNANASGKRIAATKRRIRWRWGFSNKQALEAGETGTACRGEEHDVILIWSITSGKRQVTMDGREIHYSVSRAGIVDFSWSMRGNNVVKIVAYANPPMTATPRFRQYDLLINGQSFFDMPKVYELGLKGPPQAHSRIPGDVNYYSTNRPYVDPRQQEQDDIQRAIAESLAESRRHFNEPPVPAPVPSPVPQTISPTATGSSDLLDVGGGGDILSSPTPAAPVQLPPAPVPAPIPPQQTYAAPPPSYPPSVAPVPPNPSYAASVAPGALVPVGVPPAGVPPNPYAPPAPAQSYGAPSPAFPGQPQGPPPVPVQPAAPFASPTTSVTSAPSVHQPPVNTGNLLSPTGVDAVNAAPSAFPFGVEQPLPPVDDPFAPKPPSKNEIHNAILDAYGPTDTPNGYPPMTPGAPPQPNFHTPNGVGVGVPPQAPNQPPPNVPGGLSMNAPLALNEEPEPKGEVDSALKNLVNLDDISAPAAKDLKLTMVNEEEEKKKKPGKSRGLPPAANNMVGSGATLSQIQQVKPEGAPLDPTKVMKPPPQLFSADAVNAGALVVHGQGPPPLQPQGFGVGYRNAAYY